MTEVVPFGERLAAVFAAYGRLCVGIDPHAGLLDRWGLPDSAEGVREFGLRVVEAAADRAGIVKPQVAFFERHGAAGYLALERVLQEARDADLLVIGDVKRGDIGSTMAAYAEPWLTPGSTLEVDAITASPYLGLGSLEDTMRLAETNGKGVFVLAATSNPEATAIQRSVLQQSSRAGSSIAGAIVSGVAAWNAGRLEVSNSPMGTAGVVVGATVDLAASGIDRDVDPPRPGLAVLAPGFGAQGAEVKDLRTIFGGYSGGVIVSESRSILGAGPDGIAETIVRHVDEAVTAGA
ncbi:orotidine-5'-phosphate decarboxylase [Agromyces sp. CFH 90414]|uniref:Orotidine-5'-phosphate decarboxylase n=1 Tax=Agromyces agglutinans TaxID=2662258 RepID=A0A6I2EZI7_9MICO|nr:orotidine-5'-phosphate decarboxylase [Agromyces agglutinans]MRG58545.1 orotidine-5'-phosphate decarboxylase [Agromyces agglutinans]